MENITFSQADTTDEIVKVLNKIIDNQNQIEGKLLQIIASEASTNAYNKKVDSYNKSLSKKKGGK